MIEKNVAVVKNTDSLEFYPHSENTFLTSYTESITLFVNLERIILLP